MYIKTYNHPSPAGNITLIRIENSSGAWVELSTLGAGITGLAVPDRNGFIDNVALAYGDASHYLEDGPCMGKTPGRYANRIARGHLEIDGKTYSLPVNNGPNHLHGGPQGFQNKIWDYKLTDDGVEFRIVSPDGDSGYPGELTVKATYRWHDDNRLDITLEADTTAPTAVNLTNHTYWNLNGADQGTVLGHSMRIAASRFVETDSDLTPTGTLLPVEGTPMDFRKTKEIGREIKADFPALRYGKGYDACWVLDSREGGFVAPDKPIEAVVLESHASGRRLSVSTDQPGVQVYTGNWLEGCPSNRHGRQYVDYDGVAIEAQGFPDAPHHPGFPSQRLDPGTHYRRTITYLFSII